MSDISQSTKDKIKIIEAQAEADRKRIAEQGRQQRSNSWANFDIQRLLESQRFWNDRLTTSKQPFAYAKKTVGGWKHWKKASKPMSIKDLFKW